MANQVKEPSIEDVVKNNWLNKAYMLNDYDKKVKGIYNLGKHGVWHIVPIGVAGFICVPVTNKRRRGGKLPAEYGVIKRFMVMYDRCETWKNVHVAFPVLPVNSACEYAVSAKTSVADMYERINKLRKQAETDEFYKAIYKEIKELVKSARLYKEAVLFKTENVFIVADKYYLEQKGVEVEHE
jgi:hypothetical protein